MPNNQRRYAQAVPLAYICIVVAILICAGTFGIKILMLKQQLKQGGERLGRIHKELSAVNTSNESLRTRKNQLTSLPALKKAIADGVIKLKPIEEAFVVNVPAARHAVAAADAEGGR
ncbi:MAG: hypothetical protein ABI318_18115 [Chthoniobacteraceae bacterium]